MSWGDQKSDEWNARRGRSSDGRPLDPATGLSERRAGQVYMVPHNQWGAPAGWMDADEYERTYNTGWNWKQVLALSAPFIAGGLGALAGGGGAATAGAIPSVGVTSGLPAGAAVGSTGALPTVAGAAGAAKGAGMAFGMKDALQLGPLVASLFSGGGNQEPPQNDAMNRLINLQSDRLEQSNPLYQAILAMAMGLAPKSARGGMPRAPQAVPRTQMPRAGSR